MPLGDGSPKEAGTWDYLGACVPGKALGTYKTFSVGVFQWTHKSSGKGTKKGKVVWRVSGASNNPQEVYDKAIAKIQQFEEVRQYQQANAEEEERWLNSFDKIAKSDRACLEAMQRRHLA